jgi:hypothetical protein
MGQLHRLGIILALLRRLGAISQAGFLDLSYRDRTRTNRKIVSSI